MIYWGACHIIDFLNYYLCYRAVFHVRFKNWKWVVGAMLATSVLVETLLGFRILQDELIVLNLCGIVAIIFSVDKNIKNVILLFPIVTFLSGLINILGSYIFSLIFQIPYDEFMASDVRKLATEGLGIIVCGMIVLRNRKKQKETISFSRWEYLIMLMTSGCFFLIVAISQGLMKGNDYLLTRLRGPMAVCCVLIGLSFYGLILAYLMLERKTIQYRMDKELYQSFLKAQEEHIMDIVDAEQKLRSFRHDIKAHILALESGIETGDLNQLKEYVERMKAENRKFSIQSFTGIVAVDAIISEWYQKAKEAEIQWEWKGKLPLDTTIDTFDLCVLFSNLLSNAVEASVKLEDRKERLISVEVGSMQEQIVIRVVNSCLKEVKHNKHLRTTKQDSGDHGFGTQNIQSIVEKFHGIIHRSVNEDRFVVEIVL